jgi:hypothetical protein
MNKKEYDTLLNELEAIVPVNGAFQITFELLKIIGEELSRSGINKTSKTPLIDIVYNHISDKDGVISSILVAEELGVDAKRVNKSFSHLRAKGLVEHVASNHWRVAKTNDWKELIISKCKTHHIKPDGTEAYPQRYWSVGNFSEGFAAVEDLEGWFHIKPDGTEAYPQRYWSVGNFSEGFARVEDKSGWYTINTKGEYLKTIAAGITLTSKREVMNKKEHDTSLNELEVVKPDGTEAYSHKNKWVDILEGLSEIIDTHSYKGEGK